jgi:hypothetical protein
VKTELLCPATILQLIEENLEAPTFLNDRELFTVGSLFCTVFYQYSRKSCGSGSINQIAQRSWLSSTQQTASARNTPPTSQKSFCQTVNFLWVKIADI